MVWFVWRQRFYCLITSRTFSWDSSTQGHLDFLSAVWSLKNDLRENKLIQFLDGLIDGKTMDSTQKVWFSEGIDRCFNYCFFFFLFCLKVFNRKLPIDAWKTSNQSRCMLQWREAVFHGTMDCCCSCQRRTSTDKSFYLVVWSKSRKEGIVEAVQASGYVNVLGTG